MHDAYGQDFEEEFPENKPWEDFLSAHSHFATGVVPKSFTPDKAELHRHTTDVLNIPDPHSEDNRYVPKFLEGFYTYMEPDQKSAALNMLLAILDNKEANYFTLENTQEAFKTLSREHPADIQHLVKKITSASIKLSWPRMKQAHPVRIRRWHFWRPAFRRFPKTSKGRCCQPL